jgi:chromate reductase
MTEPILNLVGITNRCTPESYNFLALKALSALMAPGMTLEIVDLQEIGFYEPGMESGVIPAPVIALSQKVAQSHGLVIWTPEYNHSLPARLKNCIDWFSRLKPNPLFNKPTMIGSATTGHLGGARVQYELRRVLDSQQAHTLIKPEVFMGQVKTKFNSQGDCVDEDTRQLLRQQIGQFKHLIVQNQKLHAL